MLARGGLDPSRLGDGLDPWIRGALARPSAGERRHDASASISASAATHLGMGGGLGALERSFVASALF